MKSIHTFNPEQIINPIAVYVYSSYKTQLERQINKIKQQLNNKIFNKVYWSDAKLMEHFKNLESWNMLDAYDNTIYQELKLKLANEFATDAQLSEYEKHVKQYKIEKELYDIDDNILEIFEIMRKQDLIISEFFSLAETIGTNFKPENIFKIKNECNVNVFSSIYYKHIGCFINNVNVKQKMEWYRDWKKLYNKEYRLIFNKINLENFQEVNELIDIEQVQKKFNEYISTYFNDLKISLEFITIEFDEKEIKKHIIVYLICFLRNYFLHNFPEVFEPFYIKLAKKINKISISGINIQDEIATKRGWYLLNGKNKDYKNILRHTKWDNNNVFNLDKEIQHEYLYVYTYKYNGF